MVDQTEYLFQQADMRSRVKKFMEMRGMTLADMEGRTGLSRPTVLRARKDGQDGIETCTLRVLQKIATVLELRVSDLFIDDAD
jgi:transcriptional regulator with XRE-family HTH domain